MTITKDTINTIKNELNADVSNVRTIKDLCRELDFTTEYTITEENGTTYIETTNGLTLGCDVDENGTITWMWIE